MKATKKLNVKITNIMIFFERSWVFKISPLSQAVTIFDKVY